MDGQIPPPPDGYTLQDSASSIPPPPPGYEIQSSQPDQLPTATVHASDQPESTFQKVNQFGNDLGDAFVHNLAKLPIAAAQNIAHGYQALTDSATSIADPTGLGAKASQFVRGKVGQLDESIKQNEQEYQSRVPTNTASVIGAGIGQVLPFALGGEAVAAPKALTTLGKIGMGAVTGGTIGGLQPVTTGSSNFAEEKAKQVGIGAALGGSLPIASRAASEVGNLGKAVLNPKAVAAENISRLVGSDPATLAKLDAASSGNIAGARQTTAQVAPSPSAVAAEKNLGNQPGYKEQLVQRQNENNDARVSVLRNYAGDDAAMQAAKNVREAATAPYRDNVLKATEVSTKPILDVIASIKRTGLGVRPTIRTALDNIESTVQSAQDANGKVPAEILDSIRQNINDFLVSPTGKQASAQEKVGVAPIRDQIIKTVGQHAPGYSDYLAAYAKHSTPINTMQAARGILARVDKRALNSTGASPLSLNDINQGLAGIEKGRYGVTPQAQKDLEAVQESIKREGISNSIRSPGSDTQYNINAQGSLAKNLLGPTFGGPTTKARVGAATVGALIGEHFGGPGGAAAGAGIGAFINKAADVVNKRIMDHYAAGLLNPQDAATMIRAYLKGNPKQASRLLGRYPQWNALLSGSAQMIQSPQKANP